MGICSSQKQTKESQNKMHQQKIIIPPQNRPDESQKVQFEEVKASKQPQNQNSRQHSPHNSHHSLRSLEQVADAEQRCSIVSQPFKKNERPPKLQSSRISKVNSSRSLQCPGSPISVRGSIQQCVQFFSTNASKKYSIITKKERQLNPDLTFVENNKTGKRARLDQKFLRKPMKTVEDLTEQFGLSNVVSSQLFKDFVYDSWKFNNRQLPISAKKEIDINMAYLIAPEQIYKEEFTSERDLWAVVMTIFILAKGQPPYKIPNNTLYDLPRIKQINFALSISLRR